MCRKHAHRMWQRRMPNREELLRALQTDRDRLSMVFLFRDDPPRAGEEQVAGWLFEELHDTLASTLRRFSSSVRRCNSCLP